MNKKIEVYALKNHNIFEREKSQSGGVFVEFAKYVLNMSGTVYGSCMDDTTKAKHIRVDTVEKLNLLQGSKYIQSEIGNTYKLAEEDLKKGKLVLFSGTSCQIAGLKSFLQKEYVNLFTIDIICHGVPSPKVWKDYVSWVEERKKKKIGNVVFRDKERFPWGWHIEKLTFEDKAIYYGETYTKLFYGHNILRPACFKCPYKNIYHPADITIGDYWGIDDIVQGFSDEKGVSMLLINNGKGRRIFERINSSFECIDTGIPTKLQQPLYEPCSEPNERQEFWLDYFRNDFGYVARKYGGWNMFETMRIMKKYLVFILKKRLRIFLRFFTVKRGDR